MQMVKKTKKQMDSIGLLLGAEGIKNLLFCLVREWWDIKWEELKVNYIELELMMFLRFHCLVLMIKDTYKMMAFIVKLIFVKVWKVSERCKQNDFIILSYIEK